MDMSVDYIGNGSGVSSKVYDSLTDEQIVLNYTRFNNNRASTLEEYESKKLSSYEQNGYMTTEQKEGITGKIRLYAGWQQNAYTANLELRDYFSENDDWKFGSTKAYLALPNTLLNIVSENDYLYNFELSEFVTRYKVQVLFDSNDFAIYEILPSGELNKTTFNSYNILIDRYGYAWTGWYLDADATARKIINGHVVGDLSSTTTGALYNIEVFDINMYRQVVAADRDNFETDRNFYLFAGWQANTYTIKYDLDDATNGINNKIYNPLRGSSNAIFDRTKVTVLTFDQDTFIDVPIRNGYDFCGWSLSYRLILDKLCTYPYVDGVGNVKLEDYPERPIWYNSHLLLYETYEHDFYYDNEGFVEDGVEVNTIVEQLGDNETSLTVLLAAHWIKHEYKVNFVMMDATTNTMLNSDGSLRYEIGTNGSTNGYFKYNTDLISLDEFNVMKENGDLTKQFYTTFDTISWYTKSSNVYC